MGCALSKNRSGKRKGNELDEFMDVQPRRFPDHEDCYTIWPTAAPDPRILDLVKAIDSLEEMDKKTMSGPCREQTQAMHRWMVDRFGFQQESGKYFVPGVRAFRLDAPPSSFADDAVVEFPSAPLSNGCTNTFGMLAKEIKTWQSSYAVLYDVDAFAGVNAATHLCRYLQGKSADGQEAFRMKFVARMAFTPILCGFDGRPRQRTPNDAVDQRLVLISVCGVDLACRLHDWWDLRTYIRNWQTVFRAASDAPPPAVGGRDLVIDTSEPVDLNQDLLRTDMIRMTRLRIRAADTAGCQVLVDTGVGLGIFAGDMLGIGATVRRLAAEALATVVSEDSEHFVSLQLIVVALPIFSKHDNFFVFKQYFEQHAKALRSRIRVPVVFADNDMHAIAWAAAQAGYQVAEVNPGDSHGVFGEYWQNYGPGTEEKLALTTVGLLTQHHACNPHVLNPARFVPVSLKATAATAQERASIAQAMRNEVLPLPQAPAATTASSDSSSSSSSSSKEPEGHEHTPSTDRESMYLPLSLSPDVAGVETAADVVVSVCNGPASSVVYCGTPMAAAGSAEAGVHIDQVEMA